MPASTWLNCGPSYDTGTKGPMNPKGKRSFKKPCAAALLRGPFSSSSAAIGRILSFTYSLTDVCRSFSSFVNSKSISPSRDYRALTPVKTRLIRFPAIYHSMVLPVHKRMQLEVQDHHDDGGLLSVSRPEDRYPIILPVRKRPDVRRD